ncbi:MAG TPA: TraR/DksA family transcriptional regulator [Casimicrobiaceae bacterium]|nr:TraR/DksA family transcriptional regulator [Casimicrobiaceae bacterium]
MAMSRFQLSKLALLLDKRHALLLEEIRDALEKGENQQYIELIGRVPADIGDQSVGDALADLNLAIIDKHVAELRDLEAARARMKDSTYGSCVECGGDIGYDRLLAYPTAKRCLRCQQQRERVYAHPGTPTL